MYVYAYIHVYTCTCKYKHTCTCMYIVYTVYIHVHVHVCTQLNLISYTYIHRISFEETRLVLHVRIIRKERDWKRVLSCDILLYLMYFHVCGAVRP